MLILKLNIIPILNSFEKGIQYSFDLLSDNNLTFFQNKINSNNNHFLSDSIYIFENSILSQKEQNEFDMNKNIANKSNININYLEQNLNEFDLQSISKINNKFTINNAIPPPLYENDIAQIINNKMTISYKIHNILISISYIKNDLRIEIVKKDITEKLNTRSNRLNKKLKNKDCIKFGRKKKEDPSIRLHNKYTTNNIIIKIKNIIKKYLIMFVNNIIIFLYGSKRINEKRTKLNLPKHASLSLIKDINYKSVANKIRKKDNLDLLTFSIEEFLSCNVSTRYRKIKKENFNDLSKYNKIVIDFLFKDNAYIYLFIFIFMNLKV